MKLWSWNVVKCWYTCKWTYIYSYTSVPEKQAKYSGRVANHYCFVIRSWNPKTNYSDWAIASLFSFNPCRRSDTIALKMPRLLHHLTLYKLCSIISPLCNKAINRRRRQSEHWTYGAETCSHHVYHKSHMKWPGTEPGHRRWKGGD
jgi:hypothetical protein